MIRESHKIPSFGEISSQLETHFTASMKLWILMASFLLAVHAWHHKYGNKFVTYSIGERFERGENEKLDFRKFNFQFQFFPGDVLIRNETIESKISLRHWPRLHRLLYKIQNHDDLLSFAQIDIIDTDVGRKWSSESQSFIDFPSF